MIYLVYAEPMGETGKETLKRPTSELVVHGEGNMWLPVTRERCNKSCEGPILSASKGSGNKGGARQPGERREKKPTTQQEGDKSNWKNSKNLFISIDEASNHVRPFGPNKVKAFRLLFTIFQLECDAKRTRDSKRRFEQSEVSRERVFDADSRVRKQRRAKRRGGY